MKHSVDRQIDRQTDRQTDRHLHFKSSDGAKNYSIYNNHSLGGQVDQDQSFYKYKIPRDLDLIYGQSLFRFVFIPLDGIPVNFLNLKGGFSKK